jgi:hypothetical protein
MTSVLPCPRSWQAEAAEDRRLSDADRASFERHVATCSDCDRAVRALAELRRLAERTEAPLSSPLEHRRAKNELLRRANELTLDAPRTVPWRGILVAAVLAALAVAVVLGIGLRAPPPDTRAVLDEPSYELIASPGAEWAPLERGAALRIAARRGRFELSVHHLVPGQRFVLVLPDGELEVQGTRFVVEVDGARTLAVRVTEGRVALRVRERAGGAVLLGAGESFAAEAPAPVGSTAPLPEDAGSLAPAPSLPAQELSEPVPAPTASSERSAPADGGSGADFTRAMNAFSSGNYGEAEALFQAFAARHPRDPRAEDATFLSAVASARRGDRDHARALAKRYLARYPSGLRRREAEKLAESLPARP